MVYEEIGHLLKQKVAAYPSVLESFFKLVLFNYIFSNGDAHLKNFSLVQSEFGDYTLSKAYDLMCTVLHTPNEEDTALDLYEADINSEFYQHYGYYGRPNFEELANKIGLIPQRAQGIMNNLLGQNNEVISMIENSFLIEEVKQKYSHYYKDKVKRFS